jgi:acyl carrier protein
MTEEDAMTGPVQASAPSNTSPDLSSTESEILRIATEVLHDTGIEPADDLFDRGVTSLAFLHILVTIRDRFGVSLTGAELGDEASVAQLARAVNAAMARLNQPA